MPLEDLTGNKYIDDLNEDWPVGATDYPDAGDDHLRGIKNVLKKTFPSITGPVNLTQDDLNTGTIPAGSNIVFYNENAPVGYVRTALSSSYMMQIVPDTSDGGGAGGTDNPILNNKIVSHTHAVSGNTGYYNASHGHTISVTQAAAHWHNPMEGAASGIEGNGSIQAGGSYGTFVWRATAPAGAHGHSASASTANLNHRHSFSATTATPGGGNPVGNWTPRYLNFIVCTKS